MSFSFVSSRGDYFSFHSFLSLRHPLRLSLFLSLLLFSTLYILSSSVLLVPFSPFLLVPWPFLSFTRSGSVSLERLAHNRHHKVIILRIRAKRAQGTTNGGRERGGQEPVLVSMAKRNRRNDHAELICSRLIPVTDHLGVFETWRTQF